LEEIGWLGVVGVNGRKAERLGGSSCGPNKSARASELFKDGTKAESFGKVLLSEAYCQEEQSS
jgi:hypothetical protein